MRYIEEINKMKNIEKIVPDTSVIIEGILVETAKEMKPSEIIIHQASLAELEHQANRGKATGTIGLEEIKTIRDYCENNSMEFRFAGKRPGTGEIKYASAGEIDNMIRDLAWEEDALLVTADKVQAQVAEAMGIKVKLIERVKEEKILSFEKFFDDQTMSVHIKADQETIAKRGMPGNWTFNKLEVVAEENVKEISKEIIEHAKSTKNCFVEIDRPGSTIVQLGRYRIVITRQPFASAAEITLVKPVKQLKLEDYALSEKLKKRVAEKAEGVLIAGSPGMGKSTFTQALAEYFDKQDKIVKTVEAPRDLVVPASITQYAISRGTNQEIHDILLLSRPDYTIFDEMRNTSDFELFTDMRLAGVGMVGVVHATRAIDAIQRFLSRVEMGIIPQIIDTVIFIKNGIPQKVLSLALRVKVPSGMTESDLARPVVEVFDFETEKLEYEIYSYGEQTIVVPVEEDSGSNSGIAGIAKIQLEKEFRRYSSDVEVEIKGDNKAIVYVDERDIAPIIGKQGKNISELEKKFGISLDIRSFDEIGGVEDQKKQKEVNIVPIDYDTEFGGNAIKFYLPKHTGDKDVGIFVDREFLITVRTSNDGKFRISTKSREGKFIRDALGGQKRNSRVILSLS